MDHFHNQGFLWNSLEFCYLCKPPGIHNDLSPTLCKYLFIVKKAFPECETRQLMNMCTQQLLIESQKTRRYPQASTYPQCKVVFCVPSPYKARQSDTQTSPVGHIVILPMKHSSPPVKFFLRRPMTWSS